MLHLRVVSEILSGLAAFFRTHVRIKFHIKDLHEMLLYRGADKSLARPGRKQATATEDFDVYVSYVLS